MSVFGVMYVFLTCLLPMQRTPLNSIEIHMVKITRIQFKHKVFGTQFNTSIFLRPLRTFFKIFVSNTEYRLGSVNLFVISLHLIFYIVRVRV